MFTCTYALVETRRYHWRDCLVRVRYKYTRRTRLPLGPAHLTSVRKRGPSTTEQTERAAYASRHRPSVWPMTRRYPTERRTATTQVPSRFPLRSDPSAFALLLAVQASVRGHLYASVFSPLPTSMAYVHTGTPHVSAPPPPQPPPLPPALPLALKAVRVLRHTRDTTRFFLATRPPCDTCVSDLTK